jgi:transposase InsO family protein
LRTLRRWRQAGQTGEDLRPTAKRPRSQKALSDEERALVIQYANSEEYAALPPAQIVPQLADGGLYLASESTFYRILKKEKMLAHRGRARAAKEPREPATHTAKAPSEVWVWDITWLPSVTTGIFYRLYMIMDLYSRKIIAWEVWKEENAERAKELVSRAALSENIASGKSPILHGDNGSALKAMTLQAKLYDLGITPSYSRPRVSNDNAHAESLFRTTKYHPSFPSEGFASLEEAQEWARTFVEWYNHEHLHSALNYVSPEQKHTGKDVEVLKHRKEVYEAAKNKNPTRWIGGQTRNWKPVKSTSLNPLKADELERELKKCA